MGALWSGGCLRQEYRLVDGALRAEKRDARVRRAPADFFRQRDRREQVAARAAARERIAGARRIFFFSTLAWKS